MSQPVKALGPNDTLALADSTMRSERIRHLPVIDNSGRVRALGFGTTTRDRTAKKLAS
jgi:CBS domain-containing protein